MKLNSPKIALFDPKNPEDRTAQEIFLAGSELPLICPHGHVDPVLFGNPAIRFSDPAALFVIPDHYVVRMLVSQGIALEDLGVAKRRNEPDYDSVKVWQTFCDHFYLFDGTPSGLWIENALAMVFGIYAKPNSENAVHLYAQIQASLETEAFSPRTLYERFNIEVLCTTDSATDPLEKHQALQRSDWQSHLRPTFRPDAVIQIGAPDWLEQINALSRVADKEITNFRSYREALEDRRSFFKNLGAVAADHGVETAFTCQLSNLEAEQLFQKGLRQTLTQDEARQFVGHMLIEMARMSAEDGLVMQLHVGPYRNHSPYIYETFGADRGFDIPVQVEWTRNLKPLLDAFGMDPRFRLILFTLDESGYARELAPIAGAYPAVRLGPPWWFYDSPNGMMRYFELVMETAGIFNTVGFNDDTRAFLSIPARHDLWRRMSARWLAKLVHQGQLDLATAQLRMVDLAYGLAKRAYRLEE